MGELPSSSLAPLCSPRPPRSPNEKLSERKAIVLLFVSQSPAISITITAGLIDSHSTHNGGGGRREQQQREATQTHNSRRVLGGALSASLLLLLLAVSLVRSMCLLLPFLLLRCDVTTAHRTHQQTPLAHLSSGAAERARCAASSPRELTAVDLTNSCFTQQTNVQRRDRRDGSRVGGVAPSLVSAPSLPPSLTPPFFASCVVVLSFLSSPWPTTVRISLLQARFNLHRTSLLRSRRALGLLVDSHPLPPPDFNPLQPPHPPSLPMVVHSFSLHLWEPQRHSGRPLSR